MTHNVPQFCKIFADNNLVRQLIEKINSQWRGFNDWRLIHYACRYGSIESIKLLVDQGVNLEAETNKNRRPIHYVCRYGSIESIKLLVDQGVDLEAEDTENWRPIHYVCQYGSIESIKLLVDQGVNLEAEDNEGCRPIHYICSHITACHFESKNRLKIIRLFLEKKVYIHTSVKVILPIHHILKISNTKMNDYDKLMAVRELEDSYAHIPWSLIPPIKLDDEINGFGKFLKISGVGPMDPEIRRLICRIMIKRLRRVNFRQHDIIGPLISCMRSDEVKEHVDNKLFSYIMHMLVLTIIPWLRINETGIFIRSVFDQMCKINTPVYDVFIEMRDNNLFTKLFEKKIGQFQVLLNKSVKSIISKEDSSDEEFVDDVEEY